MPDPLDTEYYWPSPSGNEPLYPPGYGVAEVPREGPLNPWALGEFQVPGNRGASFLDKLLEFALSDSFWTPEAQQVARNTPISMEDIAAAGRFDPDTQSIQIANPWDYDPALFQPNVLRHEWLHALDIPPTREPERSSGFLETVSPYPDSIWGVEKLNPFISMWLRQANNPKSSPEQRQLISAELFAHFGERPRLRLEDMPSDLQSYFTGILQ